MARKDDLLRFVSVCTSAKGLKVWEKILGNGGEAGFWGVYPKAFYFFFFLFHVHVVCVAISNTVSPQTHHLRWKWRRGRKFENL